MNSNLLVATVLEQSYTDLYTPALRAIALVHLLIHNQFNCHSEFIEII